MLHGGEDVEALKTRNNAIHLWNRYIDSSVSENHRECARNLIYSRVVCIECANPSIEMKKGKIGNERFQ